MSSSSVPEFIAPQLPTPEEKPPSGPGWIHEIKFDGYRTQLAVGSGICRVYTRRGHDWSRRFSPIAEEALPIGAGTVIDGEMLMTDSEGLPSFSGLQAAARTDRPLEGLVFMAFDMLMSGGKDLRSAPLEERRGLLSRIIRPGGRIQYSKAIDADPLELFSRAETAGLEGIVSKRLGTRYRSGPSRNWIKAKCYATELFDVAGIIRQPGKPTMALVARDGKYVGSAFVTLPAIRERLMQRVRSRAKAPPGFKDRPGAAYIPAGTTARVRFLRGEESLRHATLRSLEDGE